MNCHEVMELMQRDLDQDLADAEREAMLAHVRGCPGCADLYDKLQRLSGQLEVLPKVTPPFSIVDSILPKLEELGLLPEQGAAAESSAAQASERTLAGLSSHEALPETRSKRSGTPRWFSWKIAGGVAAAALALGMFIFNEQNRSLMKNADGMLAGGNIPKETALQQKAAGSDKTKLNNQTDKKDSAAGGANKGAEPNSGGQSNDSAAAPAAPARPGVAGTPIPVPSAAKDDKPVSASNAGHVLPPAKVSDSSAAQQPAEGTADLQGAPAGSSASAQAPERAPDAAASGANAAEPAPKDVQEQDQSAAGVASVEEPASSPSASADHQAMTFRMPDSNSQRGFAAAKAYTESSAASLASPDGAYTAIVKNQKVVIVGKEGQELFVSAIERKPDETISFAGWNGAKLTYSVRSADGKETSYTIDMKARSETKN